MSPIWDNASNLRSMQLPKVREKLSSLVRRGSTRKLRSTATGHDGVPTVAPVLEVDLTRVESFRLAEGWLEDPSSPKRQNGPGGRRGDGSQESDRRDPESAPRNTTTPIADLFATSTDQLATMLETIARKPTPAPAPRVVPETWSVAPPPTTAPAASVATGRPRPIRQESIPESPVAPEPQPIRISLRHSTVVNPVPTPEATSSTLSRRRTVMAWSNDIPAGPPTPSALDESSQRHSVRETSLLRSVGPNTTGLRVGGGGSGGGGNDGTKRFSMPVMQPPADLHIANRLPAPETKPTHPTPRNSSMPTPASTSTLAPTTTEVRRRSWQPAAPVPEAQGAAGPTLRRTPSTRPPSAAPTASRLAWIRQLENKSSSSGTPRSEPQRLGLRNSGGGGVAGKLAMFEQMKKQGQQPAASTISRSNSATSSRVSSGAMADSVFAANASVAGDYPPSTARTSMDSTRSHRNSAVMAYYDDEFRERMEGVAGGLSKQLNKGEEDSASGLRRVTAQLVEVGREKKAQKEEAQKEEDQSSGTGAEETGPELAKEVTQLEAQVEERQVVAPAKDDVEPAKQEAPEPLEVPVPAEEPAAVKVDSSESLEVDMSEAQLAVVNVNESETQPTDTADNAPAAATELTGADPETEKPTPENLPSPSVAPVEMREELVIVEELADEPAQDNIALSAGEEDVEVQIVGEEQGPEGAQGCSNVVGKDEVGVAAEFVVKQQDAAVAGVEAER